MRLHRDQGIFVCDYCASQAVPPIDDDGVSLIGPAKETCPVCSAGLSNGLIESVDLLFCQHCRGMLIKMDDFQLVISGLRMHRGAPAAFISPRSSTDEGRAMKCPTCGGAMDNHPYGGGGNVPVDTCESCGVLWLDRGELRRIVSAPDFVAYT
jgi:Zn-finger nucleic acid-binding protein